MEVGQYGSTFYLYVQGIDGPDGPPILLDQKFIGQYVATAEIEITSVDPYVPTRTRANESYSVKVTSSNQQWTSAHLSGTAPEISWDPLNVVLSATYEKQEVDGSIISSGIIDLDTKKSASRTILEELNSYRSDIFMYTRQSHKGTSTSKDISYLLGDIYLNQTDQSSIDQKSTACLS